MCTRAVRTLDCARKVRVHYFLPRPICRELLEGLPATTLRLDEFSRTVQGAKDHFRVSAGSRWSATGVIGDSRLIVTYGKFGDEGQGETRASASDALRAVEQALEDLGCGPIVLVEGKVPATADASDGRDVA